MQKWWVLRATILLLVLSLYGRPIGAATHDGVTVSADEARQAAAWQVLSEMRMDRQPTQWTAKRVRIGKVMMPLYVKWGIWNSNVVTSFIP